MMNHYAFALAGCNRLVKMYLLKANKSRQTMRNMQVVDMLVKQRKGGLYLKVFEKND